MRQKYFERQKKRNHIFINNMKIKISNYYHQFNPESNELCVCNVIRLFFFSNNRHHCRMDIVGCLFEITILFEKRFKYRK